MTSMQTLEDRCARGEIDQTEYQHRKAVLDGDDVIPPVRASAGGAGDEVVLEITDTGRGLAPDDLTRVFERFHRVDQHFSDGTGVGLAIAKLIVEAHGGRISATSPGLGQGSTFRIELPA